MKLQQTLYVKAQNYTMLRIKYLARCPILRLFVLVRHPIIMRNNFWKMPGALPKLDTPQTKLQHFQIQIRIW